MRSLADRLSLRASAACDRLCLMRAISSLPRLPRRTALVGHVPTAHTTARCDLVAGVRAPGRSARGGGALVYKQCSDIISSFTTTRSPRRAPLSRPSRDTCAYLAILCGERTRYARAPTDRERLAHSSSSDRRIHSSSVLRRGLVEHSAAWRYGHLHVAMTAVLLCNPP